MMSKICAIGLLGAILAAFLGELGFKNKRLVSLLTAIVLFGSLKDGIATYVERIVGLSEIAGIGDACLCSLKAVGLGYLFGFSSDLCEELGEGSVARAITVVGKVEIMLVALPYFEKTISLGVELLQ